MLAPNVTKMYYSLCLGDFGFYEQMAKNRKP